MNIHSATVYFVVQNYNGDLSGNINGNIGIYTTEAAANSAPQNPMAMININAESVAGEDPIATVINALVAKFPANTVTTIS